MKMTEINAEENLPRSNILRRIGHYFVKLNIYTNTTSFSITEQLIATRLNLSCMLISLFILMMVRSFTPKTRIMIITSPSLSEFEQLMNQYPSTFSCPCSQVNIPQNTFLSFTLRYHQICSSEFISQSWISSLFSINTSQYHPLDFRTSASSQFQVLALLCRTASKSVSNALKQFGMQTMISSHALSRIMFNAQTEALIQQLQTTTIAIVLRLDRFLALNIAYNHLESSLRTNYFVYSVPGSRGYLTHTGCYLSQDYKNMNDINDYCSCDLTYKCSFHAGFYTATVRSSSYYAPHPLPLYLIPGILSGCIPRFSIFQSTLECFYKSICLNILGLLGINTLSRHPLNISIPSRFSVDTTIESMFDELLIEEWYNTSNFSSYFNACAPISCSYTYTEHINIISMITDVLSLLGGLVVTFRLLVYLVVKYIFRRISRICCHQIPAGQEQPTTNEPIERRSLLQIVIHTMDRCRLFFLNLNIYKRSVILSDMKQQCWATHICLILLFTGMIILTIYSSVSLHLKSVTINNPSRIQFEQIHEKYSQTLSCPCTHLSIPYSHIISIQPRFHQICASDFIKEDKWFVYFDTILYTKTSKAYSFYTQDFRSNAGSSLFRIMRILCQFANETVKNALIVFNNTQFVSNEPLSTENFVIKTSVLIAQFEQQTLGSFLFLFNITRSTIEDNHFHASTDANIAHKSYVINNTWSVRLKPRTYIEGVNSSCSCLISNQCIRPQGFYCRNTSCYQQAVLPNKTVPGLILSCFPVNSLLLSTFECFYNESCIQMLYDWRLFEIADLFYPLTLNVTPLDSNLPSRFLPTTTLDVLVSRLLVEEWINATDITAHYNHCKPQICTYTYITRFEIVYVVTTIIGLFGGLFVVLRLSVPLVIRIIMQQVERRRTLRIRQANQATNLNHSLDARPLSLLARIRQGLTKMDIFNTQINNSVLATRFYFVLVIITFTIILVFTGLSHETQLYTVRLPSESTFETLHEQHSTHSLSCPCSQSSIQYGRSLSVSVNYHQVCSSNFISPYWWTLIANRGDETFILIDQPLLSNHFRMLSSLCNLSKQTVTNAINALVSNTFISVETLTRSSFESQMELSLKLFIEQTPMMFVQTLEYIVDTCRSNQLEHLFLSNWMLVYTTVTENYVLATRPLSYNNNTCTCATSISSPCWWQLVFILVNATNITLPGLVGGCLPIDGLRQSTLECLFNPLCLATIRLLINSATTPLIPDPLNPNLNTRFPYLTTKIGTMIDHLFVEEWLNITNYSAYYAECSPRACHYIIAERNAVLYRITSLLGLYGGVTIILRFIVLHVFRVLDKIQDWWHARHRRRQTIPVDHPIIA